jgi:hypothetical protein
MQQDHVESKSEEKAGGNPARAKVTPEVTSQARAVLKLQNTVGNRALAGILAPAAKNAPLQRSALSAVSVQRDELMEAIKSEYGQTVNFPLERLAKIIVSSLRASEREPVEETSDADKAKKTDKSTKEDVRRAEKRAVKLDETPKAPLSKDELAKKRKGLEAREKALSERPSDLDKEAKELTVFEEKVKLEEQERALEGQEGLPDELLNRRVRLAALKKEKANTEALRQEEAELNLPKTKGEQANEATRARLDEIKNRKKAEDDRADKRKQLAEMKAKLERQRSGQLTPEEKEDQQLEDDLAWTKKEQEFERQRKPLNEAGLGLGQILKGRRF